jgi:SAM-dependent methyltransferase
VVDLKYLRFRLFRSLLDPFSQRMRRRRMALCTGLMGFDQRRRVLDLGGQAGIWHHVETPQDLTILNLSGRAETRLQTHHDVRYVEGDACNVTDFGDEEFDVVFSNSVIEHVGPEERMRAFAREARRLGRAYWVQTPSKWFPIEAHCGMPFWWFYPESMRRWFLKRWAAKLPAWTRMIEETRVLTRQELQGLFPDAEIRTERLLGVPKSYAAYRCEPSAAPES